MAVLKYKDPTTQQFVALTNYTVQPIIPVQTTGSSTTEVMSQNAVTNELGNKANSTDVYTKTNVNSLIFGQDNVPSGSDEAKNVTQLINKTVYGTITSSSAIVVTTENLATTLSDYATNNSIANFFDGAEYGDGTLTGNTGKKVIAFKHGNTVKVEVDATPFIKDGMLDSATIGNATISGETVKCLILTFNTDSGKNAINIPINDIFNADNYVAKADVDTTISAGSTSANIPTSSAVASFVEGKGYKTIDTTYTFAEGTTNGAFNVTPNGSTTQSVKVHGLGTAAYADTDDFLAANGKAASATVADSANSVALANVSNADDLKAIEALSGTNGLLKKTAANTWELDTTAYTTNTGTVTSVSITVPTGLSVTGSPITTNGTLAIALENGYVIPQQTTLDSFLKGTVEVVSVTADNNSYNAGTIAEGTQKHVIFNNGGNADYIVTIPTTYHTPDGQAIELTVPNGGYAEANFMNINGTIYARGI